MPTTQVVALYYSSWAGRRIQRVRCVDRRKLRWPGGYSHQSPADRTGSWAGRQPAGAAGAGRPAGRRAARQGSRGRRDRKYETALDLDDKLLRSRSPARLPPNNAVKKAPRAGGRQAARSNRATKRRGGGKQDGGRPRGPETRGYLPAKNAVKLSPGGRASRRASRRGGAATGRRGETDEKSKSKSQRAARGNPRSHPPHLPHPPRARQHPSADGIANHSSPFSRWPVTQYLFYYTQP